MRSSIKSNSSTGLKRGDVLLNTESHTAMYIGNNQLVQASKNESGNYHGGKPGDQTGKEIYIRDYYDFPWNCILRYMNDDSSVTPPPSGNVYIRQGQTAANKFVGAGLTITGVRDAATKKGRNQGFTESYEPGLWRRAGCRRYLGSCHRSSPWKPLCKIRRNTVYGNSLPDSSSDTRI